MDAIRPAVMLDDELCRSLPLPLARLHRRAQNARTPLERHHAAFYLFEVSLKLMACTGLALVAAGRTAGALTEARLRMLARPSLGQVWEIVRHLLGALGPTDDGMRRLEELVLGGVREDLPRAAALLQAIDKSLGREPRGAHGIRVAQLFDALIEYRNREIGHGAAGQRPAAWYRETAPILLFGMTELLRALDVLAGRRLLYVDDVRRQRTGEFLIERFELHGESPRRLTSLVHGGSGVDLPRPQIIQLRDPVTDQHQVGPHPMVLYEAEADDFLFFSARRGPQRFEYLSYGTGRLVERRDLDGDHQAFLQRLSGELPEAPSLPELEPAEVKEAPPEETSETAAPRIGDFELVAQIGHGGMGAVYRAWQPSLSRWVALKTLAHPGDRKAEQRFLREIRALGRVDHPNLVRVHTAGTDGVNWWYTMELIDGVDLGHVLARMSDRLDPASVTAGDWSAALSTAIEDARASVRPLVPTTRSESVALPEGQLGSPKEHVRHVVDMMRRVAGAAQALHDARVIHRDIKPQNIMVTAEDGDVVLMDLGLAQLLDETEGRLTRTRQFAGTLRYASPEQVASMELVDHRTDIYGIGATLWELLTLKSLHDAAESTPEPVLHERILFDDPIRPSRYNRNVPGDLDAIVLKCLRKRKEDRYASARELAEDLQRWLSGAPVQAQPPSVGYLLGKLVRRHRTAIGLAAAILLIAIAGTIVAFVLVEGARREAVRIGDQMTVSALPTEIEHHTPDAVGIRAMRRWLERYDDVASREADYRSALPPDPSNDSPEMAELRRVVERIAELQAMRTTVARRLSRAESLVEVTVDRQRAAWKEAIEAIAQSPTYRDAAGNPLIITPQAGLVPLREHRGYWEFWHVASGERPEWDAAHDQWRLQSTTGIVLVLLPGGEYLMGWPSERPDGPTDEREHPVEISPFFLGKYEVTQGQWLREFDANPSYYQAGSMRDWMEITLLNPVDSVTRPEAILLARLWGLDLPSEEEWEYAARAGTRFLYHWSDDPSCLKDQENVGDLARKRLSSPIDYALWDDDFGAHSPVGFFTANAFGLHDMLGNMCEWVRDNYDRLYGAAPPPGEADDAELMSRHWVVRGGSYDRAPMHVSYRMPVYPPSTNRTIGVRMMRRLSTGGIIDRRAEAATEARR